MDVPRCFPLCKFLYVSVNQGVIGAKWFQNTFCKCSEMLNNHVLENMGFLGENITFKGITLSLIIKVKKMWLRCGHHRTHCLH